MPLYLKTSIPRCKQGYFFLHHQLSPRFAMFSTLRTDLLILALQNYVWRLEKVGNFAQQRVGKFIPKPLMYM